MTLVLVLLGLLPLPLGLLCDFAINTFPNTLPPLSLIGLLFLLLWGGVAFLVKPRSGSTKRVVLALNAPALLFLLLIADQVYLFGSFWSNPLGRCSQCFFLPVLRIASALTTWVPLCYLLPGFLYWVACLLLMAGASYLGCRLRKD